MNLTTSDPTNSGASKHVKGQYVAAALGLALAVSAAVAISGDLKSPSTHQVSGASTRLAVSTSAGFEISSKPEVVFYLVTDEQAVRIQEYEQIAQSVRFDARVPGPRRSVVVLRVGNSEEEATSRKLIDNAMAASNFNSDQEAPAFQVVDMRNQ